MKHFLAVFLVLSTAGAVTAQTYITDSKLFFRDVTGHPVRMGSSVTMQGSPYFFDDYCATSIKVAQGGNIYHGIEGKLDLQSGQFFYKLGNEEMESVTPLEYIVFNGCGPEGKSALFRSGYPETDKQTMTTYYQVLDTGSVQLLKFWNVTYEDNKNMYGKVIRQFSRAPVYYAYRAGQGMMKLGKGNDQLVAVFPGKQTEVNNFIHSHNLKLRKEEDLVQLFAYYNGLQK